MKSAPTQVTSPLPIGQASVSLDSASEGVHPPPFRFTPFIHTCGALDVDRWRLVGAPGVRPA